MFTYEGKLIFGSTTVRDVSSVHFVAENDPSIMHHDQFGLIEGMLGPPEGDLGEIPMTVSMMTT